MIKTINRIISEQKFSSAALTVFAILLSFTGIVTLWLHTDRKVDDLYDGREQVHILIGSWNNLDREMQNFSDKSASNANTAQLKYNLQMFDSRLNIFLESPLAGKLSQANNSFAKKLSDINTEWKTLKANIRPRYSKTARGTGLSESELSVSQIRFTAFLEGMADMLSDQITQQTIQMRLVVFILSMVIIVSIIFFINRMYKLARPRQIELERLVGQRAIEVEAAVFAAQTAKLQAEQINRQLQATVNHANLLAQQAMETGQSKNEFLANISREIRIPMNAIMGFGEMLAEENLTEQQKKQVAIIRDSSRQLLQLINDILDFSKIETGKLEVEAADCSFENILVAVESIMKPAASEKNIQFELVRKKPLPASIRTDSVRLKQCLTNLISNAIESTEKGSVYVRVSSENNDDKSLVRFDIEDTSTGISSDRLGRIFEPFSQVNGSTVRRSGSNGLRLTIAQQIAEILGGSVAAGSTVDKGSVFTLVIPTSMPAVQTAQDNDSANALRNSRPASASADNLRLSGRVLVAEDTPTNQILISLLLKRLGVEPVIVENGRLAVEKALTEKFDVILMDIMMPVMNGYEATEKLRKNGVKIPIVAQTACAMKGDDEKCFAAGCSDYISKPIDRKKLVEVLKKYLPITNEPAEKTTPVEPQNKQDKQDKQDSVMQVAVSVPAGNGEMEIDWQLLLERIGNEELIGELMPIFVKDNEERIKMLARAVAENDDKEVKFYAHSIKGASGTIGAMGIFELARQLENAGRDADKSKYKPLFKELNVRFARLTEFLAKSDWKQIASSRQHTKKA